MNTLELLDRPIAYHRIFVTLTGSVKAAIMLSQAVYWQKRAKQSDGWWYKTADEWEDETGLTRREQEKAREDAKKFLKTDLRDAPARLYWKVDEDELNRALFSLLGKSSFDKKVKLDSTKGENINKNTEITTEINRKLPIDWKILAGQDITAADLEKEKFEQEALTDFERAFAFGKLPWFANSAWTTFAKFIIRLAAESPGWADEYVIWRNGAGKYNAFSNRKIRSDPQAFMDTGYPEFCASEMYREPEIPHYNIPDKVGSPPPPERPKGI